ncbi:hypothetical protein HZH66_001067 [Vespula vulgaris]|uniref:Uncharacterized protein n=1 Tax=Vespula vulgaris TaxID=7454 RepID=A0A834KY36_VESVU|nr:hypothetical protein HZH66_001067 [Vespula vulgaris]
MWKSKASWRCCISPTATTATAAAATTIIRLCSSSSSGNNKSKRNSSQNCTTITIAPMKIETHDKRDFLPLPRLSEHNALLACPKSHTRRSDNESLQFQMNDTISKGKVKMIWIIPEGSMIDLSIIMQEFALERIQGQEEISTNSYLISSQNPQCKILIT